MHELNYEIIDELEDQVNELEDLLYAEKKKNGKLIEVIKTLCVALGCDIEDYMMEE